MRVLVLLLSALLLSHARAQTVKFDNITLEQGLSQSTVNAIVQDGHGFLWFGTQDGLNRYDGYAITIYKHLSTDAFSISDNGIWSLYRDRSGDIWIGTMRGGLNRYSIEHGRFTHFRHDPADSTSISDNNITSVFQDSRGTIWAGTLGGGLNRYDPVTGGFVRYTTILSDSTSLPDNTVWALAEDIRGTIWVATWGGLCRFVPPADSETPGMRGGNGSFVRIKRPAAPREAGGRNAVRALLARSDGSLWVGTWGAGLDRFDPTTGSVVRYLHAAADPLSLSSNQILSLLDAGDGRLWVGTGDAGLNLLDTRTGLVARYHHDPTLPRTLNNDIICSLYADSAGALWIGTGAGGVNRYDPLKNRFPHYRDNQNDQDDLAGNDVWALLEDRTGILWIGTYGDGLNRFDRTRGQFTRFVHNPNDRRSLSHNNVLSLCQDRDGILWIGTEGGGLNRFDPASGECIHYRHDARDPASLAQDEVTVLLEDRRGYLWIGTNGSGLDRLDRATGRVVHYPPVSSDTAALPAGSILALLEDHRGMLWIGMYEGGLARLDPLKGTITRFQGPEASQSPSLNNNTVLALYEDSSHVLWIGTYGGGLNRFDPRLHTWDHITEADGLPNDVVYGILPDHRGALWLPTNKGLARLTIATGAIRTYDVNDGLQGNEFNQGAYHRSSRGELFLGGINGFNAFFPDSVRENAAVAPVYLTSFRVFDRTILLPRTLTVTREIELPYDQNFLSFEFVTLSFTAPARNRYAYTLEGLDAGWIDAGTRRYVSYTNLDPGNYTLRVRGSNSDGVWNETGTALAITIVPPYWQTWWFRVIAVGTLAALLFLMYRYRVRKLLEIERIRTSIATDLHDDIGSTLTEIALYSDAGLRELRSRHAASPIPADERSRLSSLLADIGSTSRSLIDAMNEIVWSIDPKHDSFEFVLIRMKMHATKMLEAQGINYEIDIPQALSSLRLPLDYRRRVYLIYKEAINNALRHAAPQRVVLTLRRDGRLLVMTVADDGRGFDPREGGQGNGLHNMRQRAGSLGGELSVVSAPGVGTTVTLRAPIP